MPAPTREQAISALEASCQPTLLAHATLDRQLDDPDDVSGYVDGRLELTRQSIVDLDEIVPPAGDAEVFAEVRAYLSEAELILAGVRSMDLSDLSPDGPVGRALDHADEQLLFAAASLVQYGADCRPVSPPVVVAASPEGAGRLRELAPVAEIVVAPPGADNNRIAADGSGAWVAFKFVPTLVHIDHSTNEVVATIETGALRPQWVTAFEGAIWAALEDRLLRIDPVTEQIIDEWPQSDFAPIGDVYPTPSGGVVVACHDGRLIVFDESTLTIRSEVPAPLTPCIALGLRDGRVILAGHLDSADRPTSEGQAAGTGEPLVAIGDPATGEIEAVLGTYDGDLHGVVEGDTDVWAEIYTVGIIRFPLDGSGPVLYERPGEGAIVPTYGGGAYWTTRPDEQRIVRVDEVTGEIEEFNAGPGVNALAYHDGVLWASNSDAGTVMRFDVLPWPPAG